MSNVALSELSGFRDFDDPPRGSGQPSSSKGRRAGESRLPRSSRVVAVDLQGTRFPLGSTATICDATCAAQRAMMRPLMS